MACGGCGGGGFKQPNRSVKDDGVVVDTPLKNLIKAAVQQPDKIKWFKDGVTGLVKCIGENTIYTDDEIKSNREICKGCEHSSKKDGKITATSQCAAIDPETGAPCMCFIVCKTQVGKCPLGKWTKITINNT